jgi:hypothetical protein
VRLPHRRARFTGIGLFLAAHSKVEATSSALGASTLIVTTNISPDAAPASTPTIAMKPIALIPNSFWTLLWVLWVR